MQIVVGVSDAKASANAADILITYSLGSCIGVTLYDAAAGVGGMLHFQLPHSEADVQRAAEKPLMFADTGMNWLLKKLEQLGAKKQQLRVRIAGGAQMLCDVKLFDVGRRNQTAIRKILWQHGLFIDGQHIGGTVPRTLLMNIADGAVTVRCAREEISL